MDALTFSSIIRAESIVCAQRFVGTVSGFRINDPTNILCPAAAETSNEIIMCHYYYYHHHHNNIV